MVPLRYIRLTVMLLLISVGCQKKEESFKRFIDEDYNFTISPIGFLYIDSLVAYDTLYKYSNSPAGIRYGFYNFRTDSLIINSIDSTYFADIMQLSEEDKEAIAQLFFKNNIFKIKDSQLYEGDVLVHPRRNSTYIRIYKNNKYLSDLELAVLKSEDFNSAELSRPKNEILNVEMFKDSISNILFRKPKMKYLLDSTKYNESYKLRSHQ